LGDDSFPTNVQSMLCKRFLEERSVNPGDLEVEGFGGKHSTLADHLKTMRRRIESRKKELNGLKNTYKKICSSNHSGKVWSMSKGTREKKQQETTDKTLLDLIKFSVALPPALFDGERLNPSTSPSEWGREMKLWATRAGLDSGGVFSQMGEVEIAMEAYDRKWKHLREQISKKIDKLMEHSSYGETKLNQAYQSALEKAKEMSDAKLSGLTHTLDTERENYDALSTALSKGQIPTTNGRPWTDRGDWEEARRFLSTAASEILERVWDAMIERVRLAQAEDADSVHRPETDEAFMKVWDQKEAWATSLKNCSDLLEQSMLLSHPASQGSQSTGVLASTGTSRPNKAGVIRRLLGNLENSSQGFRSEATSTSPPGQNASLGTGVPVTSPTPHLTTSYPSLPSQPPPNPNPNSNHSSFSRPADPVTTHSQAARQLPPFLQPLSGRPFWENTANSCASEAFSGQNSYNPWPSPSPTQVY
jgi:hypothetical protein